MWYDKRDERTDEEMPHSEKMERYFAGMPDDALQLLISPGNSFHHEELTDSTLRVPAGDSDNLISLPETDPDIELAMRFEYHNLINSQAFRWLLTRLWRQVHLATTEPDNLSIIKQMILGHFPTSGKISKYEPVQAYTAVFDVDWDPRAFINEQQYRKCADEAIATAVTITGSSNCAQATTTTEYLDQTWPISGAWILHVLEDVVLTGSGHFSSCKFGT